MIIGVMSDSHDNLPNIEKAVRLLMENGAEALIHAGDFVAPFAVKKILEFDGPVRGVFGNNDGEKAGIAKIWKDVHEGPRVFRIGGVAILVSHSESGLTEASGVDADVHVFGHNHTPEIREGTPLVVNPGEAGGWLSGRATCAIIDTEGPSARILEID